MIATAISLLRPDVEVMIAQPETMVDVIRRYAPHVVISSRPKPTSPADVSAWVELSLDPAHRSKVCIGARDSEIFNPTLDRLLAVIDEAEEIVGTEDSLRDP